MVQEVSAASVATSLAVRRRTARPHASADTTNLWALCVDYRANGNEYAAKLGLSDERVAFEIQHLMEQVEAGDAEAGLDLFTCLHTEWGRHGPVGRHPAWDAVFRYVAQRVCGVKTAESTPTRVSADRPD